MKKYIMFFVLILTIIFSSCKISYSQKVETGNFYFLTGMAGDKEVILYLNIIGTNVFGYYNKVEDSIEIKGFVDTAGKINIKSIYGDIDIIGDLSEDGIFTSQIEDINKEVYYTKDRSGDYYLIEETNIYKINLSLADTPVNSAKISAERVRLSGQLGRGDNFKYKNIKYDFNNRKLNNIVNNSNNRDDLKICYLDDKIIILYSEAEGFSGSLNEMDIGYNYSKFMKKDGNTNYRDKNSGYPYYFVYSLETYEEIYISDFIDFSAYNSLLPKIEASSGYYKFFSYAKPYTFCVKPNGNIILGFNLDILKILEDDNQDIKDLDETYNLINEGWKFYCSLKLEIKREDYWDHYQGGGPEMDFLKLIVKKGSPLDYLIN